MYYQSEDFFSYEIDFRVWDAKWLMGLKVH